MQLHPINDILYGRMRERAIHDQFRHLCIIMFIGCDNIAHIHGVAIPDVVIVSGDPIDKSGDWEWGVLCESGKRHDERFWVDV